MNSTALLLVALLGGNLGGNNDALIKSMMDAESERFDRWTKLLKSAAVIITTGIFVLRGMPTPVDAAGKPTFTNEGLSAQIKSSFEEGKREAFWVAAVNGVVDLIIEFLRPSASERALFAALLSRPAPSATTVVTSPGYSSVGGPMVTSISAPRTAGQVLRRTAPTGFVRAQAVYVNPETGEIAVE